MWWQALLVSLASAGFPTLALLYFIGGPNYRDQRAGTGGPTKGGAKGGAKDGAKAEAGAEVKAKGN
jgi:hypothetical protein